MHPVSPRSVVLLLCSTCEASWYKWGDGLPKFIVWYCDLASVPCQLSGDRLGAECKGCARTVFSRLPPVVEPSRASICYFSSLRENVQCPWSRRALCHIKHQSCALPFKCFFTANDLNPHVICSGWLARLLAHFHVDRIPHTANLA